MNHQQIAELLPWYANCHFETGGASPGRRAFERVSACARELEETLALQQAVMIGREDSEPPRFGFTRALVRVEAYEREKAIAWWQRVPRIALMAMAAQLVMILALGAMLLWRGGEFTTATPPRSGPRIVVGFQDGVTEETVRQLVQELRGSVVSGPSALGLYTVETPGGMPKLWDKFIQKLQQNRRVILSVAALAP